VKWNLESDTSTWRATRSASGDTPSTVTQELVQLSVYEEIQKEIVVSLLDQAAQFCLILAFDCHT
jgi:hypothetical protein